MATDLGTLTYDNLFAGNVMPVVTEKVTVADGEDLDRGEVVKLDGGEIKALTATGDDPYGIMAEDCVASGSTEESVAYLTGEFNEYALEYGTGDIDNFKVKLRELGIFVKPTVKA